MSQQTIAIIGAGPASLYAAEVLAKAGKNVVILNRDIKPGGLAEFGIYLNKYKMKGGLRKMFDKILSDERISYLGNVRIGEGGDLSLDEIRGLGFDAVVVAVGAQGTKWLGLPGEHAEGCLHAKDLVYHYNSLPPFSEREFPIGQNVCVIGMGNVALDIVHWLVCERKVQRATVVARRGPGEKAYTDKEIKTVGGALDVEQVNAEFASIRAGLTEVGQDADALQAELLANKEGPLETETPTRFGFRYLRSPQGIEVDAAGKVAGLTCEKTRLVKKDDGSVSVKGLGETETIPCDTVVFAIGDSIEPSLGLPVDARTGSFATVGEPWDRFAERPRYMVYDPAAQTPVWGTFVVGWARKASDGLVGKARADAIQGCDEIMAYLDGEMAQKPAGGRDFETIKAELDALLARRQVTVIDYAAIGRLTAHEGVIAQEAGLPEYKFKSNAQMLELLQADSAGRTAAGDSSSQLATAGG